MGSFRQYENRLSVAGLLASPRTTSGVVNLPLDRVSLFRLPFLDVAEGIHGTNLVSPSDDRPSTETAMHDENDLIAGLHCPKQCLTWKSSTGTDEYTRSMQTESTTFRQCSRSNMRHRKSGLDCSEHSYTWEDHVASQTSAGDPT